MALGVTFPSIRRSVATLLFVAFLCEAVFIAFRLGPSLDSCWPNASEDDGDVKRAQKV